MHLKDEEPSNPSRTAERWRPHAREREPRQHMRLPTRLFLPLPPLELTLLGESRNASYHGMLVHIVPPSGNAAEWISLLGIGQSIRIQVEPISWPLHPAILSAQVIRATVVEETISLALAIAKTNPDYLAIVDYAASLSDGGRRSW